MSEYMGRGRRWRVPTDASALGLAGSRLALAALTVAFAALTVAGVEVPLRTQAAVYLVGMVAMNLPHGGFEHLENLRRRSRSFQTRYLALYLAAVAGFTALFFAAPVLGLALALCVAMTKGGHGGLAVLDATSGTDHLRTRPQRALAAAVRGGTVMVVPLLTQTDTFVAFSSFMVTIFDVAAVGPTMTLITEGAPVLAVGFGLLVATHLGLGYRRSPGPGRRGFLVDAGETLLLVAYFAVVPVVLAVGLYFPLWYSARQLARDDAVDGGGEPDEPGATGLDALRPITPAFAAVVTGGVLLTAGLAAGLWVLSPAPLGGAPLLLGLVSFWSVFISIVALPHVVVGAWLDRERGIWYVP